MKQEENYTLLLKIYEKQQEIYEKQQEMYKEQQEMKKEQQEMKKEQQEMKGEIQRIGNSVAVIEQEHGSKIGILLDLVTEHIKKLDDYEKRFEKDEKVIEMHGYRIALIEQK